jgi:hypothetical protein
VYLGGLCHYAVLIVWHLWCGLQVKDRSGELMKFRETTEEVSVSHTPETRLHVVVSLDWEERGPTYEGTCMLMGENKTIYYHADAGLDGNVDSKWQTKGRTPTWQYGNERRRQSQVCWLRQITRSGAGPGRRRRYSFQLPFANTTALNPCHRLNLPRTSDRT